MRPQLRVVKDGEVAIWNLVLVQFDDGDEVAVTGTKSELRQMLDRAGEVVDELP